MSDGEERDEDWERFLWTDDASEPNCRVAVRESGDTLVEVGEEQTTSRNPKAQVLSGARMWFYTEREIRWLAATLTELVAKWDAEG